jgi:hypothetical protein
VPRLPLTYTDAEKSLIYNQDRESPLPQEIKSFWLSTLETKFVVLDGENEFSLFLMPHILEKKYKITLDLELIEFNPAHPLLIAFSADE